jgi:hypothetical protein
MASGLIHRVIVHRGQALLLRKTTSFESRTHGYGAFPLQHRCTLASSCAACSAFTGSYFLVLIFFVVMAMLLAIFSSLIDYRERGLV